MREEGGGEAAAGARKEEEEEMAEEEEVLLPFLLLIEMGMESLVFLRCTLVLPLHFQASLGLGEHF